MDEGKVILYHPPSNPGPVIRNRTCIDCTGSIKIGSIDLGRFQTESNNSLIVNIIFWWIHSITFFYGIFLGIPIWKQMAIPSLFPFSVKDLQQDSMKNIMEWFHQKIDGNDVNNEFNTVKVGKRSPLIHPL